MHQIRLVEKEAVQRHGLRVLHQHLAGLADARQQLVNGLGGVHQRFFRARPFLAHGVIRAVEGVKGRVRQPGFVEMQVVDVAVQQLLDGFGVVEDAVVGGLRERKNARAHRFGVHMPQQRIGANLGLDGLRLERLACNGADDSVMVARGPEKHRHRPRHDDGVQDAFVAVAVYHHHIARRHGVMPHDFVAGGSAVGGEKAVVGIEDARRVALALADGAVVIQQLAQLFHGVAHIGAQHVLAVKLVIHLPDGAFEKRHTARMAGAVPGVGAVFRVVQQRLEKRRLYAFQIRTGLANDVPRHKLRRVFKHVDEAVQLAQDVVGQVLAGLGLAMQVDGHIRVLAPHLLDEMAQIQNGRGQTGAGVVRAGAELLIVNRKNEGAGAALLLGKLRQIAIAGGAHHLKALFLDGFGQRPDAQARSVVVAVVLVDDDDGEMEFHGRGLLLALQSGKAKNACVFHASATARRQV